jgi:hypothetical protein
MGPLTKLRLIHETSQRTRQSIHRDADDKIVACISVARRERIVTLFLLPSQPHRSILLHPTALDCNQFIMLRLLLLLLSMLLFAPSSAAALDCSDQGRRTEWEMEERLGRGGSDSLLCPEVIELTIADERVRRLLEEFLDTDSGFDCIGDAPARASRSRCGSCDDVVQCFRVAGVRLLTFGTAPPGVDNED